MSRVSRLENFGKNLQARLSIAYIDIRRRVGNIPNAEVHSNIKIHASRKSLDNPDPQAISTTPVIVSVTLHMENTVDLKNNDTVILKIVNSKNEIIEAFRGTVGDPWTVNSRKRASLTMNQLGRDDIRDSVTSAPPLTDDKRLSVIAVHFVDGAGTQIHKDLVHHTPKGENIFIDALDLHGWTFSHAIFDGEIKNQDIISFEPESDAYSVTFVYDQISVPVHIKQFAAGRFRRDDGTFGNGAHWYINIPITWIGEWEFLSPVDNVMHVETRQTLRITQGSRLMLFPQKSIVEVTQIIKQDDKFAVTVKCTDPTEVEEFAYITNFYGNL